MQDNHDNKASRVEVPAQNAQGYGNVPQGAAPYGNVPQAAVSDGIVRHSATRKESHILTVKEVARLFEVAGVARIERSIVNWCQPNRQGVARLDAFFDTNERKWFITPESVDRAIAEEKARMAERAESLPHAAATPVEGGKSSEAGEGDDKSRQPARPEEIQKLEKEIFELKILNKGKDFVIEKLTEERGKFIERLEERSHRIGVLETQLRQLAAPQTGPNGDSASASQG